MKIQVSSFKTEQILHFWVQSVTDTGKGTVCHLVVGQLVQSCKRQQLRGIAAFYSSS